MTNLRRRSVCASRLGHLLPTVLIGWLFACLLCARSVAEPMPSDLRLPAAHPYATLQPKTPSPAHRLYVADTRFLSPDQKLLLASLQGLVNRTQPRIYLVADADDAFWLAELQRRGWTGEPIRVAKPLSLLTKFRGAFRGAVVADPKVYVSPCIAVDYAGADNLVIATPALAHQLHLPILQDLRGRFTNDAAALRFARKSLMPRLNSRLMLCIDPPLLGLQVDDVIAARGIAFWVTGPKAQSLPGANGAAERQELIKAFARAPLDGIVRGYWWHGDRMGLDEGPGVTLASQYGKITTVSDYVENFSVLSGYRLSALKQKPQSPPIALDRSKVYVAITISDGDNLCPWRGVFRKYFNDPLHGAFPVGWGMGPTLVDVAPVQAQWYYDHARPTDEFMCDVSGAGYINPAQWGAALADHDEAMRSFWAWTNRYMRRMDMKTVRIMYVRSPEIASAMAHLPGVSFVMPDYNYQKEAAYSDLTYSLPTGQAVFRAATGGPANSMAGQIRQRVGSARPAFLNVVIAPWGMKMAELKKMLDDLGPEYVAVTPSELNRLYREANPPQAATVSANSSPAAK